MKDDGKKLHVRRRYDRYILVQLTIEGVERKRNATWYWSKRYLANATDKAL